MNKILVVDDDRECVEMMTHILEGEGYPVVSAMDGEAGLKAAREQCPDLVILDVEMPVKNGFEVLYEMREDQQLRDIPVIILTVISRQGGSDLAESDAARYAAKELTSYVEKPFEPEALLSTVAEALS